MKTFLALMLISFSAYADSFHVEWKALADNKPYGLTEYGFKYSADGIDCIVGEVERMIPAGEKRHITCFAGKEKIADRDVRCDKQQVENFIDIGILYLECKTN